MRKEERLKELQLDKEAEILKREQEDKDPKEILRKIRVKEQNRLAKDKISIDTYFGIPGVYFLFKDEELVYIGESQCIFTRISQHIKEDKKQFDSFRYTKMGTGEEHRKKVERNLIKKYRPKLNFQHNLALQ